MNNNEFILDARLCSTYIYNIRNQHCYVFRSNQNELSDLSIKSALLYKDKKIIINFPKYHILTLNFVHTFISRFLYYENYDKYDLNYSIYRKYKYNPPDNGDQMNIYIRGLNKDYNILIPELINKIKKHIKLSRKKEPTFKWHLKLIY
jgi:hypothetical protein